MQSSSGCDGERSYQVLSCEVRASDEVASICQGEEPAKQEFSKTCLAGAGGKPGHTTRTKALTLPRRRWQLRASTSTSGASFPVNHAQPGPPTARFPPSGSQALVPHHGSGHVSSKYGP